MALCVYNTSSTVINVELTPICGNKFKPGKPSEQAQTLGQFLNDIVLHRYIITIDTF